MENWFKRIWKWTGDQSGAIGAIAGVISAAGAIAIPVMLWDYQKAQDQAEDAEKAQTAVKTYLSQLTTIFLEGKFEGKKYLGLEEEERLRTVIRASTLATLKDPNLEGEHKRQIIGYLNDLELIQAQRDGGEEGLQIAREPLISLAGADLSGAHLQDLDLFHADLRGANFQKADLRGTDLSVANLSSANRYDPLIDKPLNDPPTICPEGTGADFRKAILENTDFAVANLINADFRGATITHTTRFEGAKLTCADFRGAEGCVNSSYGEELREAKGHDLRLCQELLIEFDPDKPTK